MWSWQRERINKGREEENEKGEGEEDTRGQPLSHTTSHGIRRKETLRTIVHSRGPEFGKAHAWVGCGYPLEGSF